MEGNIVADLFTSALSGMNAAQLGVATAEHNIANASTPGYTRQQILVGSRPGQQTGGGFVGQGVDVTGVIRIYDQFLNTQVLQEQNQASYLTAYHAAIKQIDNLIADPAAGASPAMQSFFEALNGVANNPESVPARQTMLANAQFAVNRFQAIDQRLTDITDGLTGQIVNSVNMVNSYAQQISVLNGSIKRATAASGQGQQPNDLIDQRDRLISQLNQEIKTAVLQQPDGTVSVFVGTGQALVVDEQTMRLQVVNSASDPSKIDIAYLNNGRTITLQQSSLQGGNLGAYLNFRDQTLEPARNALGRVALGMAANLNQQNKLGQDLNGALGGNLFNVASPRIEKNANNDAASGLPSVVIADVAGLTTSDYQLRFNGGTSYTLLRLSDNVATTFASLPQTVDGMTITAPAAVAIGDSFLIRPTANGARDIALATNDPTKIAAAAPIRGTAALANTGTATISSGTVNAPPPPNANLQVSVTLAFNDPPTTYSLSLSNASIAADVADPVDPLVTGPTSIVTVASTSGLAVGDPVVGGGFPAGTTVGSITDGATFVAQMPVGGATNPPAPVSGQTLQVGSYAYTSGSNISFNGWTTQISGAPAVGDIFTIESNVNATGDNRNALLMSSMQTQNLMANGTVNLQGAYGQLVGEIGAKTGELAVTSLAQTNMVAQTVAAQQAVSGVNLDEEAANLIRYQKAYQAAAKAMQIAQTMFDAIMAI